MKDKILIIVPTRSRGQKILEFIDSWNITSPTQADLLICLDEDDAHNYTLVESEGLMIDIGPRIRMIPTLNRAALKYMKDYKYIGFAGDDHRYRTPGWDKEFIESIQANGGVGIVYGNDLLQGKTLATEVVMSSNIIQTLGYMVPPGLIHLYADNFWMDLGKRCGCLEYLPEVVIEHCHFTNGKSGVDALYEEVNSHSMFEHDRQAYELYCSTQLENDVQKITGLQHVQRIANLSNSESVADSN